MTIVTIKQLEKRVQNTLLIPAFDLTVRRGETIAIHCNAEIGNTFIKMLIGELPSTSGKIEYEAAVATKQHLFKHIGLSLQSDALYERLNLKEYLQFFHKLYEAATNVDVILERIGLADKKHLRTGKLSYSEKKRLHFARMLLHNPDLLIMEDPAQNLDIESTIILHRLITELEAEGKALILTTNNLETAISMTDHVFRLNESGLKKIELVEEDKNDSIEEVDNEPSSEETSSEFNNQIRFDKIPAKVDDKLILFDPTEIDFIESNSGVSNLNVKGEVFPCSFTLNDLYTRLQPFGFFRCHRSYIVNLQKVREVVTWTRNSYSLVLDDPKKSSIPLSKGKLDELKDIIGI